MKFRPILLAWLLLLGATLAMGGGAWWLLDREADRIEAVTAGVLASSAASLAESLDLLMEDIRTGVSEGLLQARISPDPKASLAELTTNNPYVLNGFYYRTADGVTNWYGERDKMPNPSSLKQGQAGMLPWSIEAPTDAKDDVAAGEFNRLFDMEEQKANAAPEMNTAPTDVYEAVAQAPSVSNEPSTGYAKKDAPPRSSLQSKSEALKQQRANVRKVIIIGNQVESGDAQMEEYEEIPPAPTHPSEYGLILRSQQEDSLQFLTENDTDFGQSIQRERNQQILAEGLSMNPERYGWLEREIDGDDRWMIWSNLTQGPDIIGAWLSREAVLAELAKTINISQVPDVHFVLVNDAGQRVVGAKGGRSLWRSETEPILELAIGTSLPGWRIEAYPALTENPFGRGFRLLGGLVVAGLCVAILLGGSLLLWQAQRDALDAQRKTTFVANVSHELKTPLTSIRLFAEMLHDGRVGDETKQKRYLQTMLNETQRLTRLVNNVLDFSRLERGRRDFQTEPLDLDAAVAEIIEAQRERLEADGLALKYIGAGHPVEAVVDRDAVEQILLNLLDNAAKYAISGERAEVRLTATEQEWQLAVCDFGPGIPSRERQLVFEAFHRMDDRLTADRPGCGLGLSIAARLTQGMGGRLSLRDNQPQGCCFQLNAPLKPEPAHA